MSQHVDIIHMKKDNNLHTYVYFTLLQKMIMLDAIQEWLFGGAMSYVEGKRFFTY